VGKFNDEGRANKQDRDVDELKLAADCFQLAGSVAMLEVVAMDPEGRGTGQWEEARCPT
jgi:hypothetical protein